MRNKTPREREKSSKMANSTHTMLSAICRQLARIEGRLDDIEEMLRYHRPYLIDDEAEVGVDISSHSDSGAEETIRKRKRVVESDSDEGQGKVDRIRKCHYMAGTAWNREPTEQYVSDVDDTGKEKPQK